MKRFLETILSSIIGAVLLGAASLSAAGEMEGMTHKHHFPAVGEIDVMTQNQYLGADLGPVLAAAISGGQFDPTAFNNAVVEALGKIAATRPVERVQALAEQIAQRNPDVVGLQEAYKFECTQYPGVPEDKGCNDPAIKHAFTDQLQNTEVALRERYVVAGKVTNIKVDNIPFLVNDFPALLSIADRDAILVRKDLRPSLVPFTKADCPGGRSGDGCNYMTRPPDLVLNTPTGDEIRIALVRGFLAVDVTVKGWHYRVFNTHLEQRLLAENLPETRLLQVGQAYELVGFALATRNRWDGLSKKVIVIGDINSDPRDTIPMPPYPATLPGTPLPVLTPYAVFMGNGFTDAWTQRYHHRPGLTCCQAEDLENRRSELEERIDMIFSLDQPLRVLDMELLGNKKRDKTDPPPKGGLWPSDHAALAATLMFKSAAFASWVGDRD
jgi:endonuclease/exonuclease/phosphatase family metal-dependent hydrolase